MAREIDQKKPEVKPAKIRQQKDTGRASRQEQREQLRKKTFSRTTGSEY